MSRLKLKMTLIAVLLICLWSTPARSNHLYGKYLLSTDPSMMVWIVNLPQFGDALGVFWGDTLLVYSFFSSVLPVSVGGQYLMTTARGPLYVTDGWGNWLYLCDVRVKHRAAINFGGSMLSPEEYTVELLGINNKLLYEEPIIPLSP